jgi:uncharacterized protein YndB with AHSA1/START domain
MGAELEQVDGRWRLRVRRRLAHPREKVWRALTEAGHLAAWFPTTVEFPDERVPGAKLRFAFREHDLPAFDGELLAYEPPELLEFRWGPDLLRFELRADGTGTELTLFDVLEEKGKAARDAAGWDVKLAELAAHLDGVPPDPTETDWPRLNDGYAERFGPDAATVGPPDGTG